MPGNDVKFNDVSLETTYSVVMNRVELAPIHSAKGEKSLIADMGVVPEGSMGSLKIRMSGTIVGTSNTDVRDKWSNLLRALRGTDRIKKGRLDIHGDSHYFCQLVGSSPIPLLQGDGKASISLEFEADEPYRRANTLVTYSDIVSLSDPFIQTNYGTTFSGNAFRIPVVIKAWTGLSFLKNDKIRVQNLTVGWRFEHVMTQALSAGQPLVIDGEACEVLENGVAVGEGTAGVFPYLRGGVTNLLSLSGSTTSVLLGPWTVEFWDRYLV